MKRNYKNISKIKIHILLILFSMIVVGSYGDESMEKYLNFIPLLSGDAEVPVASIEPSKTKRAIASAPSLLIPCAGCSEPYSQGTGGCQDFDGDGVANKCDIDDDNDGVLDTIENNGNGNCWSSGGENISTLSFEPTSGNSTTVTTTETGLNVTGDSWHSDYTTNTVTVPFHFEFTADASIGNLMIGVIGASQSQPTGDYSYAGNSYKFHFRDGVYYNVRKFTGPQLNNDMYAAGDRFNIEINANNKIIMRRNGFVVYTDDITTGDTQYKLAVSVASGRTFSNVVWGSANTITVNCQYSDADEDGVPNRFETDSDNDGCPDAFEAGVSSDSSFEEFGAVNVGSNGFENSIETSPESGVYDGLYNHSPVINAAMDACQDSGDPDGDELPDVVDIDDDNDGVLDIIESGTRSCGDGIVRTISWDWEHEHTTAENWGYFADKPETRLQGGPGLSLTGDGGGTWYVEGLYNDGTLTDAVAKEEHQYGQFTVREKGIYVTSWVYIAIEYRDPSYYGNPPNVGILIDEDPNFNSPTVINDGTQPTQSYRTVNSYEKLVHLSNPTYLWPFTTYYVRFYDLKQPSVPESPFSISHDLIGLGFEEATGSDCMQGVDTDKDGVPNRLDLDSDGDGCSDSYEAGAITSEVSDHRFSSTPDSNGNGLNDNVEDSSTGQINYSSTYDPYVLSNAIRLCADTDNDGVKDLDDIDADNDGIVNSIESPGCFYTKKELESGNRNSFVRVTTGFNMEAAYHAPDELTDGDVGTSAASYAVQFVNSQAVTPGSNIFTFEFVVPIRLKNIYLQYVSGNSHFNDGAKAKLQGSNDGEIWTDLNSESTYNQTNGSGFVLDQGSMNYHLFSVAPGSEARYRYYRIAGVSGSLWDGGYSNEVYFETPGGFVASANPKPVCSRDPDGDGTFNHLDTDSDGDSCPDVYEAGVPGATRGTGNYTDHVVVDPAAPTAGVGINGYKDALETSPDSDVPNFSPRYIYAGSKALNVCADTDNDGVGDLDDIDADNDGVINSTESPGCFYTAGELGSGDRSGFVKVTTGFNMVSPYNTPNKLVDRDAGTAAASYAVQFVDSQTITSGSNIFTFEFVVPVKLKNIYLRYVDNNSHFDDGAKAKLQGSNDGATWTDLNQETNYNQTNASSHVPPGQGSMRHHRFSVASGSAARYKYYRIAGVSGTIRNSGYSNEVYFETASDFVSSANPKPVCSRDTDGDGTVNHLDLDSDGDTCPDVYEAEVPGATRGTGNYTDNIVVDPATPTAGVGTNGYKDALETSADSNVPNFTPRYIHADSKALSVCADTDNDGVGDLDDIDMDNDGIINSIESPDCFYTAKELESGDRSGFVKVSTEFDMLQPYHALHELVDGDAGTLEENIAVRFYNGQTITPGSNIFTFEFVVPVKLKNIYLQYMRYDRSHFERDSEAKLQGSNDGETWTDLNQGGTYGDRSTWNFVLDRGRIYYHLFPVTQFASRYRYYRIAGVSGNLIGGSSTEVYFEAPSDFVPSSAPKPICFRDTDGDGIFDHLDLDSDGDSCPDVYEAGVPGATKGTGDYTDNIVVDPTTPTAGVGINGYKDALEAPGDSGVPNFTSGYHYAVDPSMDACADTDNDGKPDVVDIDDDNDGIFDVHEQTCTASDISSGESKSGMTVTKPESINYTFFGPNQTFANLVDGVDANDPVIHNPSGTLDNAEWFRVEFPVPKTLISWEVAHYAGQTLFSASSTYKVQGSNDGTVWSDLTGTLTYSGEEPGQSSQAGNSNVAEFPENKLPYRLYRYFGISGEIGDGWATEFFFVERICTDPDTDRDGIPNRMDLDSDGDSCPDAGEAGVVGYIKGIPGAEYSGGEVVNTDISFSHPEAVAGPGPAGTEAYGANGFYSAIESDDNGTATYNNTDGYTYGKASDPSVTACICFGIPVVSGEALVPLHGTTTLGRAGPAMDASQWLVPRSGAHLVLESKTRGFVISRMASPETSIASPVPGMAVYDTDDNCIKIYVDDTDKWKCFSVQTCND